MDTNMGLKKLRLKRKAVILLLLLIIITAFCYWQNNAIGITGISYTNKDIPASNRPEMAVVTLQKRR